MPKLKDPLREERVLGACGIQHRADRAKQKFLLAGIE